MKIVRNVLFVLFTILICSNQLHAQNTLLDAKDLSQFNTDDLSDRQIISLYNKAVQSGMTEPDFYKLLVDKGLPDSEITKLKDRVERMNSDEKLNVKKDESSEKDNNQLHPYDTSGIKRHIQSFKNDQAIFGSELFTTNSLVFEPNLRIPAPAGYFRP